MNNDQQAEKDYELLLKTWDSLNPETRKKIKRELRCGKFKKRAKEQLNNTSPLYLALVAGLLSSSISYLMVGGRIPGIVLAFVVLVANLSLISEATGGKIFSNKPINRR